MIRFTQKYTIVQFFEDVDEGHKYSSDNWPLHTTVVDTFAINLSADEIIATLAKALSNQPVAKSVAEHDRHFGQDGEVQVVLLKRTPSLVALHLNVLAALSDGGLILNDPQFAREGFVPHATVQKHARLEKGQAVAFSALSIVDMFPSKDPYSRKVLKTIKIQS